MDFKTLIWLNTESPLVSTRGLFYVIIPNAKKMELLSRMQHDQFKIGNIPRNIDQGFYLV